MARMYNQAPDLRDLCLSGFPSHLVCVYLRTNFSSLEICNSSDTYAQQGR